MAAKYPEGELAGLEEDPDKKDSENEFHNGDGTKLHVEHINELPVSSSYTFRLKPQSNCSLEMTLTGTSL
jgi:hypothetical protein